MFGGYMVKLDRFPVQRMMLANAVFLQCFCLLFVTKVISKTALLFSNKPY